jgi:hypothetical protein
MPDLTSDRELEEFWGWRPPFLNAAKDHIKSDQTRAPTHYDMHMDESLILKRIVPLPSLLTDLKNVVDESVIAARSILPRIKKASEFPHQGTRAATMRNTSTSMVDEEGVINFYVDTTAKFCAPVASMLGLQHRRWRSSLICKRQPQQRAFAIADAFLKINPKIHDDGFLSSPLQPEVQSGLEAIAEANILHLAVWEFKNLLAGRLNVMRAIGSLGGPFKWLVCTQEDGENSCKTPTKHLRHGKRTITGSRMGFDATETPWDISKEISGGYNHKRKRKRDQDDGDYSPDGEVITNASVKKAHRIIQQVNPLILSSDTVILTSGTFQKTWAQAVRNDATLLVVSSGNLEFIGVRHRESRTLFLSPLIDVQNVPAYAKLHTGLYIAAFRDTVDRALQLRDAEKPPLSWTHKYYPHEEGDNNDNNPRGTHR